MPAHVGFFENGGYERAMTARMCCDQSRVTWSAWDELVLANVVG
jgi:hypothetical protein